MSNHTNNSSADTKPSLKQELEKKKQKRNTIIFSALFFVALFVIIGIVSTNQPKTVSNQASELEQMSELIASPTPQVTITPRYVPNQLIVKFKDQALEASESSTELNTSFFQGDAVAYSAVDPQSVDRTVDSILRKHNVQSVKKVFHQEEQTLDVDAQSILQFGQQSLSPSSESEQKSLPSSSLLDLAKVHTLSFQPTTQGEEKDLDMIEEELEATGEFEYVEKNLILDLFDVPNDPLYERQWALEMMNMPAVYEQFESRELSDPPVVVAVLDSGIDRTHPDLPNDRLLQGYDTSGVAEGRARGGPPVGFGSVDDPIDINGHGTFVAGQILGLIGNGVGITGMTENVYVMPVKVFYHVRDEQGNIFERNDRYVLNATIDSLAAAIEQLPEKIEEQLPGNTSNYNLVVNMSLGGSGTKPEALEEAIQNVEARLSGKVIFIAAAGNNGVNIEVDQSPIWPASLDNVITISAVGPDGKIASFSNFGNIVDGAAPGGKNDGDVYSAIFSLNGLAPTYAMPKDSQYPFGEQRLLRDLHEIGIPEVSGLGYAPAMGTSMATPYAAGVAALVWSTQPNDSADQVWQKIVTNVQQPGPPDDHPCADGPFSSCYGAGLIDAAAALGIESSQGPASGACVPDTRTKLAWPETYQGEPARTDSVTVGGVFYNSTHTQRQVHRWSNNSSQLGNVERYQTGPCAGQGASCRFDTRTLYYDVGGSFMEAITVGEDMYRYRIDLGNNDPYTLIPGSTTLHENVCNETGSCRINTHVLYEMGGEIYEEITTAEGILYKYNQSTEDFIDSLPMTSISKYVPAQGDGPCSNKSSCTFDTHVYYTDFDGSLVEEITKGDTVWKRVGEGSWTQTTTSADGLCAVQ